MTQPDRLLGIVLHLQGRSWQRAADLADHFDVSLRTIYRDMHRLGEAGVPVVAVPGRGYRLAEGYVLPPLLFTTDEAVMLLLGSRLITEHVDEGLSRAAKAAAFKIVRALPEDIHTEAVRLEESVRFIPINVFDRPAEETSLRALRRALVERRRIQFHETAADGGTAGAAGAVHTLDPYGLVEQGGAWYVVGYSHARAGVHTFRLARMQGLTVLDEAFVRPAGYRPARGEGPASREVTVRVLFDRHVARWVREAPLSYVVASEEVAEGLLVTLRVHRETEVLPWLLGWGAHARVLTPATLRTRLAQEAERIAAQYVSDPVIFG